LADIAERLTQPEIIALQTKVLAPGQTSPIDDVIIECCDECRGYVANAPRNIPMGSGLSIPSKLKGAVLSLIVVRAASRLPTKIMQTEAREKASNEAIHLLERVADSKFAVDRPSADQIDHVESINSAYPAFSANTRRRTFRNQFGV
jgi:hypothetical protein